MFVFGIFNILHPGHLRLLRFAAECGDCLIVGVLSDKLAPGVQFDAKMRSEGISALSWVDYTLILDKEPQEIISSIKPNILVMGKEHENSNSKLFSTIRSYGGEVLFGSGNATFSSLDLLKRN